MTNKKVKDNKRLIAVGINRDIHKKVKKRCNSEGLIIGRVVDKLLLVWLDKGDNK